MSENLPEQLSTQETVTVLKNAIARLEELATRFEENPPEQVSTGELSELASNIDRLASTLQAAPPPETSPEPEPEAPVTDKFDIEEGLPPSEPETPPKPTKTPAAVGQETEESSFVFTLWAKLLQLVRKLLPDSWTEKLSDGVLSGIVAAAIVVLFFSSTVFSGGSSPQQVAENPSTPLEQPTPSPQPEVKQPKPTPSPKVEQPKPKRVQPRPSRPAKLTPEQSLIAAIQDQVSEITNEYAEGLIRSIQANFVASRLVVTVGEEWYDLPNPKQDQLAAEVLGRSQKLDFRKITMLDPEGTMIARSPVVGNQMVILQRISN